MRVRFIVVGNGAALLTRGAFLSRATFASSHITDAFPLFTKRTRAYSTVLHTKVNRVRVWHYRIYSLQKKTSALCAIDPARPVRYNVRGVRAVVRDYLTRQNRDVLARSEG